MVDALFQDTRYAWRQILRARGFSCVVILTLALGVGANTSLYSLLNAIVLRPLPVTDPQRLAIISVTDRRAQQPQFIYYDTFATFQAQQRLFEEMSLYAGGGQLTTEARGVLTPAGIEGGTPQYYKVLGVRPFLGRFISDADAPPAREAAPVVVIGYRFWQKQFGGDPHAIGETLTVDGMPLTIIGVTPPEFHGLYVDAGSDFSVPMSVIRKLAGDPTRPIRARNIIARLRAGITLEQARAEVSAIWPGIQGATLPSGLSPREQDEMRAQQVKIESGTGGFSPLRVRYASPLSVLLGLTAVLLTIACVNLSSLLLSRAVAREQQLAICLALGATRGRLVQQLLVESLLLSCIGAIAAVPFAWWASRALTATIWTSNAPLLISVTPDVRVLSLTAAIAIATGLIVGVLPALAATRTQAQVGLQPARAVTATKSSWGKTLLVAQVALSLALLFGAGLLTKTLANLRAIDVGTYTSGMLWTRVTSIPGGYRSFDEATYYPELVRRLAALPGIESVGLSRMFPAYLAFNQNAMLQPVALTDLASGSDEVGAIVDEVVSPGFFHTVGISFIDGRDFTWRDDRQSPGVAVISASLQRRLFPTGRAIGQRIRIGSDPKLRTIEVVGIVTDAAIGNLRDPHVPVVFRPLLQGLARIPIVNLRTTVQPAAIGNAVQRTVASLGREYVRRLYTLEEQVDQSLMQERVMAALSSFFAGMAMLLAFVGLYGLLAYAVVRRTREIGVRMALGASRVRVLRMVVSEAIAITIVGILVGVPCALGAGRLTGTLLFGLTSSDPTTLAAAAASFVVIGAVASFIPARRASGIDPMAALRCD